MALSKDAQYSAISIHSLVMGTPQVIREWLMQSRLDSPVNHSVSPVKNKAKKIVEIYGQSYLKPFALYNQNTYSWKIPRAYSDIKNKSSCRPIMGLFLDSWLQSGMMFRGTVFQQNNLIPYNCEIDFGDLQLKRVDRILFPTLSTYGFKNSSKSDIKLKSLFEKSIITCDEYKAFLHHKTNFRYLEYCMRWPNGSLSKRPLNQNYEIWKNNIFNHFEMEYTGRKIRSKANLNISKIAGNGQDPLCAAMAFYLLLFRYEQFKKNFKKPIMGFFFKE